jgi:hypothetical protein
LKRAPPKGRGGPGAFAPVPRRLPPAGSPPGAHRIKGWGHPPRDVPPSRGVFVGAWSDPRPPAADPGVPGPPFGGSGGPPHPPGRRERGVTKKPTAPPGACSGWGQSPPSEDAKLTEGPSRDPCCRWEKGTTEPGTSPRNGWGTPLEGRPRASRGASIHSLSHA